MPRPCPACLSKQDASLVERLEDCSFFRCAACGLQYVDPVPAATPVFRDFSDHAPSLPSDEGGGSGDELALTSNELSILRLLRRHIQPKATVLELCCESGRFLAALKRAGFTPLGMDPLPTHVAALRENGFDATIGMVEAYPPGLPAPKAVVLLESLVRFPEPLEVLTSIRERFPEALLCCSVPSPRRSLKVPEFDRRLDYPPDHLTRWTPAALRKALARAGYASESGLARVNLVRRRGSRRSRLLRRAFALFLRTTGEDEYSLIATGRPTARARTWSGLVGSVAGHSAWEAF